MSWTLVDLSKVETDILRKSVIDLFIMESNVMQLVPWETIGQLSTGVIKTQALPSVSFRRLYEGYSESTGTLLHETEQIAFMGGYIDTDKAIARAKNTVADARAINQNLMMKAIAYDFQDKFINGNVVTDAKTFKGIRQRIDEIAVTYAGQKIDAACGGKGIMLDATEQHRFLDSMDKLIYAIRGHKPDALIMNAKCLLAARSVIRRAGLLDTSRDMFDRVVERYQGIPLFVIGTKADLSTEIILSTETTGGADGGTECTSIYAVKFGIGENLWGIQEYPLEVTDKGLLQDKPVYRTEIDWPLGLALVDHMSVARLYNVIPDASS